MISEDICVWQIKREKSDGNEENKILAKPASYPF
jgi:hypothetical protein